MVVLSLFDGMSCGRIAFDRAGIPVTKYYASEIDKYAEKISASNWSDIIRLGDITKWREWQIDQPDIIIAGSPCQGFSMAGKRLNFNDPRSALFFTFVDILTHYKPKYFLLENVKMKKEWCDKITELVGVEPIEINSALVSAQNRRRLYWTNIPGITQPKDKGILLKDIIESGENTTGAILSVRAVEGFKRRKAAQQARGNGHGHTIIALDGKANALLSRSGKDGKENILVMAGSAEGVKGPDYNRRVYSVEGKVPTLNGASGGNLEPKISGNSITWRKLTVTECERLQTVPDGYCRAVSKTRAYHALGNGWTVDVIAHILKGLNNV